ncbi:SDR family oxidoreductase [Parasphingorhabdus sp.]|uniref:SDR family oxidoreductase n=1 Tax=Parasphingorhabdus sp. TaxID=2709688 RepID=UPI003D2A0F74
MTASLALVTGGVRRVGAAIAGKLAQAGYALALHGHSNAEPDDDLKSILSAQKTDWHGFVADFDESNAPIALLAEVRAHFGRTPDVLVNSASIFGQDDASNIDVKSLEQHLRVNVMVPVLLATELAKQTASGQRAAVVQILDQRVRNPNRDQLSYTLSKQALAESVRTLAIACAEKLRVNGVAPGLTLTAGEYGDKQLANITEMMPLDRLPNPDDIAEAVLYFARADAVTGQTLCVDGGANLRAFERDFVHLGHD